MEAPLIITTIFPVPRVSAIEGVANLMSELNVGGTDKKDNQTERARVRAGQLVSLMCSEVGCLCIQVWVPMLPWEPWQTKSSEVA